MQVSLPSPIEFDANTLHRKRRVKCDETRPYCHRCCKFGRACSGYEHGPKLTSEKRALLPKSYSRGIRPDPSHPMFENDWDFTYFQYFCGETCDELSGVFEFAIWNQIVLQASFHHPFIRHAIITLASMSKNVKSALNRPEHVVTRANPANQVPKRILRHYNRFLKGSRKALDGGHQTTRLALIVCLLIVCVETLQWHHHQALYHIYAGTNLLDEWMSTNLKPTHKLPDDFIEDEIAQQFRTLEVEASSLFDPRPKSYHDKHLSEGLEAIQTMPGVFSNLQEARIYLDLIRRRIRHFIGSLRPGKVGRSNLQPEFESPGFRTSFDTLESFSSLSECTKHVQERYTTEIRRWEAAFEPLFLSTSPTKKRVLRHPTPQNPFKYPTHTSLRRAHAHRDDIRCLPP
jgi:hypothetical protein